MNYKQNDYELIYMVRENDEVSQDLLYEKYLPIIKNLASEFYQKYNSYGYDFDDFFQEALIAFQKSIINFNEEKETLFYTFTVLCIRRALLSFCRNISNKTKNVSNNNYVSIEEYDNIFLDQKADIEMISNYYEIEKILKELIISLPFENSCIFELRLNGFSYREISILLDIPTSTVEFKNRSAKRKLEQLLNVFYKETI